MKRSSTWIKLKTQIHNLLFLRLLKSTSFRSFIFELNVKFLQRQLGKKGFMLNMTLSTINQTRPIGSIPLKASIQEWIPVFQGGIDSLSQFRYLEKTLLNFRQDFDFQFCILSTFTLKDEVREALEVSYIRDYLKIVENKDPGKLKPPLAQNFLRQMQNTFSGLNLANDLGFRYSIKIRIDQRISNSETLEGIAWLMSQFPVHKDLARDRVVCTSFNTYKTLPLFLSDCLMFGNTQDLIEYWSPADSEEFYPISQELSSKFSLRQELLNHPEIWLAARYLSGRIAHDAISVEEANRLFWTRLAMVVDATAIGQVWQKQPEALKTNYKSTKWFEKHLDERFSEMSHWDWLTQFGINSKISRA